MFGESNIPFLFNAIALFYDLHFTVIKWSIFYLFFSFSFYIVQKLSTKFNTA